jgi:hypothetical protein
MYAGVPITRPSSEVTSVSVFARPASVLPDSGRITPVFASPKSSSFTSSIAM